MLRAYMEVYAWDLLDEGIDEVLDRLHGSIGITALTLPVATGPVLQLRRRNVSPRHFRTAGGAGFFPAAHCYAECKLKTAAD